MSTKTFLLLLFFPLATATAARAADNVTEYFLDTVDSGDGSWPCLFYELNYNTDITYAERAKWYASDEDESYWREGIGPFSIDQNKFLVTQWQSSVHPILIRRHFTLTAEDLVKIEIGVVNMMYSYDENPTFWLNGTRIATATGWNDDNYATYRFPNARKKLLVEGDNVLCVSLQQGSGGGHIDYGLSVTYDPTSTAINPLLASPEEEDERVYNLQGQIVNSESTNSKSSSGIIITQGKKIFRK